jgi:hypothetical protein
MGDIERRRRQFIRTHHPDRGGDADAFIAGMRAFSAEQAPGEPPATVVVVRRRNWPVRLTGATARRLAHGRKPSRVR